MLYIIIEIEVGVSLDMNLIECTVFSVKINTQF